MTQRPLPLGLGTPVKVVAIVDDEKEVREACAALLEQNGYEVVSCSEDAETLIEEITTKKSSALLECDTVLIDYHLGDWNRRNGLDAAKEIRRFLPSARITIVSGAHSVKGLVIGEGFQFLPKPFTLTKLVSLLG
jgi:two-component system, cell cycle sensor histidine kinase and response regulator CckA